VDIQGDNKTTMTGIASKN